MVNKLQKLFQNLLTLYLNYSFDISRNKCIGKKIKTKRNIGCTSNVKKLSKDRMVFKVNK